ncbi:MAG: hypothetical protein WKF30_17730 [Pyrinomonadaceae bacterium]
MHHSSGNDDARDPDAADHVADADAEILPYVLKRRLRAPLAGLGPRRDFQKRGAVRFITGRSPM